jgi:hypothetical protein
MMMMPVFSVYRSGNISSETVDDLFGDLKTALSAKRVIFLVGLIWLFLTIVIFVGYRLRQRVPQRDKNSLLESDNEIKDMV